jgi:deoxyadenosine/deoxycytidine kinase
MLVSIDGNIGCGKSTLLQKLQEDDVVSALFQIRTEPIHEWSAALHLFFSDPTRWSLLMNAKAMMSLAKIAQESQDRRTLMERSPHSAMWIFTEAHKDVIHPEEYNVLRELHTALTQDKLQYDLMFYLRSSPSTCLTRAQTRNRDAEADLTLEYLQTLHSQYDKVFHTQPRVVTIDADADPDTVFTEVRRILLCHFTQAGH